MTELVIERTFAASIRTLWRAWTEPALLARWQGPVGSTSRMHHFDLRPGGTAHYEMIFEGHGSMFGKCIWEQVEPFGHLQWINGFADGEANFAQHPAAPEWPLSWRNTLTLTALGARTHSRLTIAAIDADAAQQAAFAAGFASMEQGWGGTLGQLDGLLDDLVERKQARQLHLVTEGADRLVISRVFAAPVDRVYRAFTEPALIRAWMLGPGEKWTMPVCEVDLQVGGRSRYVWRSADGEEMTVNGRFEVIEPNACLVHREIFEPDWTSGEARITTRFQATDDGTRVTMEIDYPTPAARDMAFGSPMAEGMEAGYDRLVEQLARSPK